MNNEIDSSNAGQSKGIASLIIGIGAVIISFIPCFSLLSLFFGLFALILGYLGLSEAKKNNAPTSMPTAGLILGGIAVLISGLFVLVFAGIIGSLFLWS
ncbi:hypothetical protein GKZ90_0023840 [Flavobacterium sp. MC2016-06]|uniref:hypothetical protein n=1 Tax=Flavobacterium sp. MC2016-06 TaxID=2676308 RepID=UPI0012BAD956|nr:hypothetical protein [Flavobacterium sp. MC2016-06]MBU3860728.1 hypothetical protein [Flavobacterium sp. MC2016-06]